MTGGTATRGGERRSGLYPCLALEEEAGKTAESMVDFCHPLPVCCPAGDLLEGLGFRSCSDYTLRVWAAPQKGKDGGRSGADPVAFTVLRHLAVAGGFL